MAGGTGIAGRRGKTGLPRMLVRAARSSGEGFKRVVQRPSTHNPRPERGILAVKKEAKGAGGGGMSYTCKSPKFDTQIESMHLM